LSELLFPCGCIKCNGIVTSGDGHWCLTCAQSLADAVGKDYCPRCGIDAEPYLVRKEGCSHCRSTASPLNHIVRVAPYDSPIGELVRRLKYGRDQRLDQPLGKLLADSIALAPWLGEVDALVPVPITFSSRLRYGYRPVDQIADQVGRQIGLPALPVLRVKGKKRNQVGLSPSQRIANVRGVFHLRRRANVESKTLCIIDDVATTGATIREVGRTLKKAGAKEVYGAILTRAGHRPTDPLTI
jgi:ComF family protein